MFTNVATNRQLVQLLAEAAQAGRVRHAWPHESRLAFSVFPAAAAVAAVAAAGISFPPPADAVLAISRSLAAPASPAAPEDVHLLTSRCSRVNSDGAQRAVLGG